MAFFKKTQRTACDIALTAVNRPDPFVQPFSDRARALVEAFGPVRHDNFDEFQNAAKAAGMILNYRNREEFFESPVYDIIILSLAGDRFLAKAFNVTGEAFIGRFGPLHDKNMSEFLHAASDEKLAVKHSLGDIPRGKSVRDWRDQWDGISRLSQAD